MSPKTTAMRTGGEILADQLLAHGADIGFCVPGESYLALLDALYDRRDRFRLVNARHEAGAANMAEAHGKLTGRPGLCLVTRGPGATHAAVGVHTAFQDSTPMILVVGQVARGAAGREAFQEIDYGKMFGAIAKWVVQVESADRIPELTSRAFHVATSGRCGPVVMAFPEDVLTETADVSDAAPYRPAQPQAAPEDIGQFAELLAGSERPVMLVGGSGWTDSAATAVAEFAERAGVPVACSFRRQDIASNHSEAFCGELGTAGPPTLPQRFREADLVIAVGARLGEITTQGYGIMKVPSPLPKLVHVYPDADELGRVYAPDLPIVASAQSFAIALRSLAPIVPATRTAWQQRLRREYLEASFVPSNQLALDLGTAMAQLQELLPADAAITLDAGNHTGWPQRFYRFGRPGREIGPTSGAMGYSVPAAVGIAIASDRFVVCCVGDGGFMMSGLEVATAVQYGVAPIVLVFNNAMYGTIRMHQEREFPGRVIGTDLPSADIVALAKALGAHAERIERTVDFRPAFERARLSGRAAVLELVCDPRQITTRTRLPGGPT